MKRIIALLLAVILVLNGCGTYTTTGNATIIIESTSEAPDITATSEKAVSNVLETDTEANTEHIDGKNDTNIQNLNFTGLDDTKLLRYTEDNLYADLEYQLNSDDYVIEGVNAVYKSKEYLEELQYNSKSNIVFGYSLDELDEQFEGNKYYFTLSDDGKTEVQLYNAISDDTYSRVVKNIAIGTGVILVCATVSMVTAGTGTPATVSLIFAASAKTATSFALSTGTISAVAAGAIKGYQTGDVEEAVKAAAVSGSESFKWGAISGAVIGGAEEAYLMHTAAKTSETVIESAEYAVEYLDEASNVSYIKVNNTVSEIPEPSVAEEIAAKYYGGETQVSYLSGEKVSQFTSGATRPDIVRTVDGHLEAIEVKRYDITNNSNVSELYSVLENQITTRAENLPAGTTQRICLNIQGREVSEEILNDVIAGLRSRFADIPIDVFM
jgi:hypothetical protein